MRGVMTNYSSLSTHHSSAPFYVTGGTLSRDALSYVTRQADGDLYSGLMQRQFCHVLTSRQMGKSSLMVRTAARLRESGAGVVLLDMTAIGQNLTAEQWYSGLLTQIGQQLELDDELEGFWDAHPKLGPLQRWMQAIRRVLLPRYPGPVVIFVDEIDAVRNLPFSTDEFFAAIREFYNRRTEDEELRRLTFCLLGVASPSDLIRDTRTTPFNIGRRIELHDFTAAEAAPLAMGLPRSSEIGGRLLSRIFYWTNGHPYLTQRLCWAAAEETQVSTPAEVDRLCEEMFLSRQAQERDDNLLFVRERMLRGEVDVAGLLSLYLQTHRGKRVMDDETNPLVSVLRLSGITRVEDDRLQVRNRIYERVFDREWAQSNMPDAELRRQREAYRQGLLRATAVASLIIIFCSGLSIYAFSQRNLANQYAREQERTLARLQSALDEAKRQEGVAIEQRKLTEEQNQLATSQRNRADQYAREQERTLTRLQSALAEAKRQEGVAIEQRKLAEEQSQLAAKRRTEAEEQRQVAVRQRVEAQTQRDRAVWQEQSNRRLLYAAHMNLAQHAWESADAGRVEELLESHRPHSGGEDLRGFEWYYLWRLSHRFSSTLRHNDTVLSVAFSPDGKRLATGSLEDHIVKLWDAATGQELITLKGHSDAVTSVAFSPGGKRLATGSSDRTVKLWDAATSQETLTLKGHTSAVWSVAFSPDGKRLATGSQDHSVKLWDAATGQELLTLRGHSDSVQSVAFSPDGKRLATGGGAGTVKLWDAATGQELLTLKGPSEGIRSVAFSPDGKRLATGRADFTVKLWHADSGQELLTLKGHSGSVASVAFSPDGKRLATGSVDRTVRLWDAGAGQELLTLKGHSGIVASVAFSPDGKRLATGSSDRTAKLWDAGAGQETLTLKAHHSYVPSVAFSPDGKRLATGSWDRTVKLWDADAGQELLTLKGHSGAVGSVAFSPDGKRLATGRRDTTVKLWDAGSGQETLTLKGHSDGVL